MVRWRRSGGSFLILAFAVPLAAQTAAVGQGETCSIEGSVTAAESGTPLAWAEVSVYRNGASDVPEAVTSDAGGHYVVDDLEPGRYSVVAQRNGYLPQTYGQRRRNREGITLVLDPGRKLQGIDFKLIATGVIVGRVLGEDNDPRVGATVQAFTSGYARGRRRLLAAGLAMSNDLGEYRIYGLAPGVYYVSVLGEDPHQQYRRPKGAPAEEQYISTFYPNASEFAYATMIDVVGGGETRGIDIVALKRRSFHVRGRILGFDSTVGSPRVQISAFETASPASPVSQGADITPDAQGNFDFDGVTPGAYRISTTFVQKGSFKTASRLVQVGDSDVNNLSLAPDSGIILQGRVRVEGEKPVDPSKLQINLTDSDSPISLPIPVKADGTFSAHAEHNVYQIGISRLPEDFYLDSVRLADREIVATNIDLTESMGGPLDLLISGSGGRIDGMVKNQKNEPASGASVALVPDISHRQESSLFKSTTVDQNGRFTIHGIRPGGYKLFAWDDIERDAWQDPEVLLRFEDKGEEVNIEASGHVSRDLISIKPE